MRVEVDRWVCLRESDVLPKAIIQRVRVTDRATGRSGVVLFRVVTFSIHPIERKLVGYAETLEDANEMVRYDVPVDTGRGARSFAEYPRFGA